MIDASVAIGVGLLMFFGAGWVGRLFSYHADLSESDGVVRDGTIFKIWREDEPDKFARRIEGLRFSATFSWFLFKAGGATFIIVGVVEMLRSFF